MTSDQKRKRVESAFAAAAAGAAAAAADVDSEPHHDLVTVHSGDSGFEDSGGPDGLKSREGLGGGKSGKCSKAAEGPPSAFAVAAATAEDTEAARTYASVLPRPLFPPRSGDENQNTSNMYGPASLSSGGVDIVGKLLENIARNGKPSGDQGFKPCFEFPDDIPVFTADHESKLLCECHNFALPDGRSAMMARCDAGDNCVGKNSNIEGHEASGGGVVLRSLLTPEELTVFQLTGESPKESRLCVLCARWYQASAYFWCQETRNEKVLQNTIIKWYVNPRDCPGGYRSEMMVPMGAYPGWRCMVGPVACNALHKLRLVKRGRSWWVDQSAMLWRDPTERAVESDTGRVRLFR